MRERGPAADSRGTRSSEKESKKVREKRREGESILILCRLCAAREMQAGSDRYAGRDRYADIGEFMSYLHVNISTRLHV